MSYDSFYDIARSRQHTGRSVRCPCVWWDGGVRVNNHDKDTRTVHAGQGQLRSCDAECTKRHTTR